MRKCELCTLSAAEGDIICRICSRTFDANRPRLAAEMTAYDSIRRNIDSANDLIEARGKPFPLRIF